MDDPVTPLPAAPAPAMDAVTASAASEAGMPSANVPPPKTGVLFLAGIPYAAFVLWCVFLLAVLPSPTGEAGVLVSVGLLTSLLGVLAFVGVGLLALKRISASPTSIEMRRRSLIVVVVLLLPGVLLGAVTPILISLEPSFPIDIVQPATAAELVAPVAVTLSAERATSILRNLGHRAVKYQWDTDGDGKIKEETDVPTTTGRYERRGVDTPVVRIMLGGGDYRRITRRVSIPTAVFSVTPARPVVEKAIKFSVAGLLTDPKLFKQ